MAGFRRLLVLTSFATFGQAAVVIAPRAWPSAGADR